MVRCPWYSIRHVDHKQPIREKCGHSYVHLLRRNTVEYRQENGGGKDSGKDDVHDVEGVSPAQLQSKPYVREPLVWTAFEVELVTHGRCFDDLPLTVELVRIQMDLHRGRRQVHLRRVVGPRSEHQVTDLLVEWVVGDVDVAHGLEDAAGLPADRSVRFDCRLELRVLAVYALSSAQNSQRLQFMQLTFDCMCASFLQDASTSLCPSPYVHLPLPTYLCPPPAHLPLSTSLCLPPSVHLPQGQREVEASCKNLIVGEQLTEEKRRRLYMCVCVSKAS